MKSTIKKYAQTNTAQKELLIKLVLGEGKSITKAAEILSINKHTAGGIVRAYRRDGEFIKRRRGGNNYRKVSEEILHKVENVAENNSQLTLYQMKTKLEEDNIFISVTSIFDALIKLKITLKKCHTELDRVNNQQTIALRQQYATNFINNAPSDMSKCIFIDESGFNLQIRRTQARSKKGTRAKVLLPTIRGRNITLIAAISGNGVIHHMIIDDGTCNSNKFCLFVEELIALLSIDPDMDGAWLILDNARIHKTENLRQIVADSPFSLEFLSPYSYMLNPIENVFSKVKLYVRSKLGDPLVKNSLKDIMREGLYSVTPLDCAGYVMKMTRNLSIAAAGQPMPID